MYVLPPIYLIHVPLRVERLQGAVDGLEGPLRLHLDIGGLLNVAPLEARGSPQHGVGGALQRGLRLIEHFLLRD